MAAILGISAYYHDSAACLVREGEIVAAAQEERFTRKKHDAGFPAHAVAYCLREGGIEAAQLDYVGFYDKPLLKFERLLENYCGVAPRGLRSFLTAMPVWLKEKLFTREEIRKALGGYAGPVLFAEHHESHAASAFYPSPFSEAAVLALDGVGEWATSSYGVGRGKDLELLAELHYPHSLGMLYSAFTHYTGFKVNSGEYKVMGLAPYGEPRYADRILERLVQLKDDGSFKLNMTYLNYLHGLTMTNGAVGVALTIHHKVLGHPRRHRSEGDSMQGAYLGPAFSDAEIARFLAAAGAVAERPAEPELVERTARLLAEEKVVGWFQGRMEFGPRALGNRSILGDPRSPRMQSVMNLKIKFRESFRPFAPSVLREQVAEWFELDVDSPYMLLVAPVRARWRIAMREDEQRLFG